MKEEEKLKLVIYDTEGVEHIIEITRKEAAGIISSLAEHLE